MPIYAYKCGSCGHSKDVLQKISDAPLTDCPACGASAFAKQVTAAGFQLKGSGWYVTDFRGGNSGAGSNGGAATEAKNDAQADVKPASGGDAAAPASAAAGAAASSGGGSGSADGGGKAAAATATSSAGGCGSSCACH